MRQILSNLTIIATLIFITIIFIAQQVTPEDYSWTQNTVSELASQGYTKKWIMQTGFISFGLLLTLATATNIKRNISSLIEEAPLMLYALAILFSGIFCTTPFIETVSYSIREARLHSLFATIAGLAFSATVAAHMFTDPIIKRKWWHLVFLTLITGISLTFGMVSANIGIIQRILYGVSFFWLIFIYKPPSKGTLKQFN